MVISGGDIAVFFHGTTQRRAHPLTKDLRHHWEADEAEALARVSYPIPLIQILSCVALAGAEGALLGLGDWVLLLSPLRWLMHLWMTFNCLVRSNQSPSSNNPPKRLTECIVGDDQEPYVATQVTPEVLERNSLNFLAYDWFPLVA
jgi:hypothetical protein